MSEGNKINGPNITNRFSPNAPIDPEMIDEDNLMTVTERFKANASMSDGVSGKLPIDTLYENTSVGVVDNPREGSTPAPVCLNSEMFPHRRL